MDVLTILDKTVKQAVNLFLVFTIDSFTAAINALFEREKKVKQSRNMDMGSTNTKYTIIDAECIAQKSMPLHCSYRNKGSDKLATDGKIPSEQCLNKRQSVH